MDEPQESLPMSRWSLALARIMAQGGLLAGIFGVLAALLALSGSSGKSPG